MAAVDFTTIDFSNGGATRVQTVVATWQEIQIPNWAKLVTVQPKNQAIYFSYNATDGASVGSERFSQAVDSIVQYNPLQTRHVRSLFFASQTGTASIELLFE